MRSRRKGKLVNECTLEIDDERAARPFWTKTAAWRTFVVYARGPSTGVASWAFRASLPALDAYCWLRGW
jgi:hypothetical protein